MINLTFSFKPDVSVSLRGNGRIAGTLTKASIASQGLVRVYTRSNMLLVGCVYADSSGVYELPRLKDDKYVVLSLDEQTQFNAVIRDNITPVAMT